MNQKLKYECFLLCFGHLIFSTQMLRLMNLRWHYSEYLFPTVLLHVHLGNESPKDPSVFCMLHLDFQIAPTNISQSLAHHSLSFNHHMLQ